MTAGLRLTGEAFRRLGLAEQGRVHSVFAQTINLRLDGLGDAGWLSLHGPGPIASPFGLACGSTASTAVRLGAPVRIGRERVEVDGLDRIRLRGAAITDTALPALAPAPPVADCLRVARPAAAGGLLPAVAALLTGTPPPGDALSRLAAPALARLLSATAREDAPGCGRAAAALIGLGPGLTPSGDDGLLGWIAAAWTAGPSGRALVEAVGPILLAASRARTGVLSVAFLAAALAGVVNEPLGRFVAEPDLVHVTALLGLGATSGADCLAGYLLARRGLADC